MFEISLDVLYVVAVAKLKSLFKEKDGIYDEAVFFLFKHTFF